MGDIVKLSAGRIFRPETLRRNAACGSITGAGIRGLAPAIRSRCCNVGEDCENLIENYQRSLSKVVSRLFFCLDLFTCYSIVFPRILRR